MTFDPYPYQQYCVDRITQAVLHGASIGLFLDMGLGKTAITLTAANDLRYNRWAIGKMLIVAPKKVAEGTWSREAAKWSHTKHMRTSLVLGTVGQRIRALATPSDIYIINRENVPWLVEYYMHSWPFDLVVLDESSSFKNSQSKRFKALKLVRSRIRSIVELTGTPSPNGLIDLWAQVFLLDGGERLCKTLGQYRTRFFDPDKRNQLQVFSYKPKDGSFERIQEAISDICISMKSEDYLTLPERIYNIIPTVLNPAAQKAYKQMEKEMLLEVMNGEITAQSAGVLTNKLLQLCNGAVYDANRVAHEIHKCKIELFLETIEGLNGKSALVFYNFQHDRDRLLAALDKSGLRVRVYQNTQDETDWNNGEIDILLAHPASCAYGLNLQDGGHHIIWFGLTWSLEQYEQANKRLHRQGQRYPVIIHHLVTQGDKGEGSIDEVVMKALQGKGDIQAALMEALKARVGSA